MTAAIDRSAEALLNWICRQVWRRKILFLVSSVAIFGLLMTWVISQQPMYEATVVLVGGQPALGQIEQQKREDDETRVALLTRIAESDEVVKAAALDVGLPRLAPPQPPARPSVFARLRHFLYPNAYEAAHQMDPVDADVARIKGGLILRGEQNADIIRISYRNADPELAVQFANAMASHFIDRQMQLASRIGAAGFFEQQRQRFEAEAKRASKALQEFSGRTNIFAVQEQRDLLLKRRDALALEMSNTKGNVTEMIAQRQSLADGLRKLIPVARSPYVSSLVDALGGDRPDPHQDSHIVDEHTSDPPLLLIRVYQDEMSALFKINSDLQGAENLLKQQANEIESITSDLNELLRHQEEFVRLKGDVDRATLNLELYSKRMTEEQIDAELSRSRLSSVRVLQDAVATDHPVFPNYRFMTVVAAALSVFLSTLVTLLFRRSVKSSERHYEHVFSATTYGP